MNHGATDGPQHMLSPAGLAAWRILRSGHRRHAFWLLAHPRSTPELIFQAWVLAMRRTFSREASDQRVAVYLEGVINRTGRSATDLQIAELIDLAFNNSSSVSRNVKRGILPILADLVQSQFPSGEQCAELVRAAESRADRLRRKARKRPTVAGLGSALPTSGPRSVVGQILKAQASYDRELLSALPDEESSEAAAELIDQATAAVLRERFPSPSSVELVPKFAARVAKSSSDVRLDEILAEVVVRDALLPQSTIELPDDLMLHAKIMTFVQAVEDLGLYSREIDSIISAAERAAENAGVRLKAMP
ncbi:hypothetical protein Q3V37_01400 [Micromonospora profundi]|uniref:Uncharacterized protein n=1 Tax=Micromonospora profundi TaxID=1420889 RepID=A0AAJ6HWS9_9ACTN|nr:hypothetical protein [Micromonospora profundi]WLS45970.1 hypothetical protein Q3V37_01400 [Micromonospora profundi]